MTTIQRVDNTTTTTQKRPLLTPVKTGAAATAGIAVTTARMFTKSKPLNKAHKYIGLATAALTLLHIGTAAFYHHKYKKM